MKKPVHIEIPGRYTAITKHETRCPPHAPYKLAYANCNYWKHAEFSIIEQYYDAKDVFICLTEVHNKEEISIPFHCERYDLYWLYQLKGHKEILDDRGINKILRIHKGQYILTAMPEGNYYAYFKPGNHLLFYFVVKSEWLLRNDGAGLDLIDNFLAQLKQNQEAKDIAFDQELLTIGPVVQRLLLSIFTLPNAIPISLDTRLYKRSIGLLVQSLQDLAHNVVFEDQHRFLIKQIQLYVSEQVEEGPIPPIKEIAAHFEVSLSYLRKYHQQYHGVDLQHFIKEVKLGYAYYLITQSNLSISAIATMCGYADRASLRKAFGKYFGFPPSQLR